MFSQESSLFQRISKKYCGTGEAVYTLIYILQIQCSVDGLEGEKGLPENNTKIKQSENQGFIFIN